MRLLFAAILFAASALTPLSRAPAQAVVQVLPGQDAAFRAFLDGLRPRALAAGVSAATFDAVIPTLSFNSRVIELDRAQPGGTPTSSPSAAIARFEPYRVKHVDADRIGRGRRRYQDLRPRLAAIEARTGVPESIMMAIYGHETGYGTFAGDFDLLRALASLAYEGRRRALFTDEFIATLKLLERGIPRSTLKGSWAGATGYPQFLPSMYLRLAVDGDGDSKVDIWSNEADALASIGNYLINAGWKPNVPWGVAAVVPSGLDREAVKPLVTSPRCPRVHQRHSRWLSIAEWRRLGVVPAGSSVPADTELASLIEPDGPGETAYLLSSNYRAILDYNCSNFYALSVGLLADAVAR
ncbi:lytic transglycosylase [Sphingomonas oleivorans]|uniref:Lytic transglycosylase n=1 Tax=Sphingomonas oleivorans TaxID=1735121 RepID=A0A2T5FYW0_9SPHN|nr:lytic murein transglycosylase [Sphingomonas oleivorans]PTQ11702.1 lytic transglycosylase [Sphingomonas oleivorans]